MHTSPAPRRDIHLQVAGTRVVAREEHRNTLIALWSCVQDMHDESTLGLFAQSGNDPVVQQWRVGEVLRFRKNTGAAVVARVEHVVLFSRGITPHQNKK